MSGATAISVTQSKYWPVLVLALFAAVTVAYCFPLISSWNLAGEYDWDYHLFLHEVPRKTIAEYGQFPLWNPYYAGGLSAIGNSQARYLSPAVLFSLAFGTLAGLKLEIFTHIFAGLLGMYMLARQLRLSRLSSLVPAFVFSLNSYFSLHFSAGHMNFLPLAYLPFIVLFFLKALDQDRRFMLLSAGAIALLVLEGGGLHLAPVLLFFALYAGLLSLERKSARPLLAMLGAVFFAVLYSAPKLLPALETAWAFPRFAGLEKPLSLADLYHIFLNPSQGLHSQAFLSLQWSWYEYGAYIGPFALAAFAASFMVYRKIDPLTVCGLVFLAIAMGNFSSFSPWRLLHALPVFKYLHVLSRFLILFVFALALRAGMFFNYCELACPRRRLFLAGGVLLVLGNLLAVNGGAFREAFKLNSDFARERGAAFMQTVFEEKDYYGSFSTMYPSTLKNRGVVDGYEPIQVKSYAVPVQSPRYRGEYYLNNGKGNVKMTYWSPNRMAYNADIAVRGRLVINQNYEKNWKTKPFLKIYPHEGLLAVDIGPAHERVEFLYAPRSFAAGLYLLLAGLVLSCSLLYAGCAGDARETKTGLVHPV